MEKNIKIIDEDTIEVEGTKYYAYERDATCVCNYCELASISCKGIPCTPAQRKDGRNVYFTKEHLDMEKRITAPDGFEIEKVEIVNNEAVVTFREKERKLPKSWEEFCEIGTSKGAYVLNEYGEIISAARPSGKILPENDKAILPDRATAEAVLALCQLIQLRDCYNGDWVPDWRKGCDTFTIEFECANITSERRTWRVASPLFFKTRELRDKFLRNFRPLIEKLKPLYGIKEGGEE